MPIDYSKFDSIDDSDEESAKPQTYSAPVKKSSNGGYPSQKNTGVIKAADKTQRETLDFTDPTEKFATMLGGSSGGGGPSRSGGGSGGSSRGGGGPSRQGGGQNDLNGLASELEQYFGGQSASQNDSQAEKKTDGPQRLHVKADGRKKIHTTNKDGSEMVEEYDEKTGKLLLRKTRKPPVLGGEGEWITEVGQVQERVFDPTVDLVKPSMSNPIFLRMDTTDKFQWRIRNLPYPKDVYSITVDHDKQQIVVRTSNKKYYKRIDLEDLRRHSLRMEEAKLSWVHQHNTLIISYDKPSTVSKAEKELLKEADSKAVKMPAIGMPGM